MRRSDERVWIPSKPAVRDNFHDSELTIWYTTIRPCMNYVRGNSQRIELRNAGNKIDQRRDNFSGYEKKENFEIEELNHQLRNK